MAQPDDPGVLRDEIYDQRASVASLICMIVGLTALVLAMIFFIAATAPCAWASPFGPMVVQNAAIEEGVSPSFALAVAHVESHLDCAAPDSPAGAVGIMQVMPATAVAMGVSTAELRTCEGSARAGVRYLKAALKRTKGDEEAAAHLYTAGLGSKPRHSPYARKVMARERGLP